MCVTMTVSGESPTLLLSASKSALFPMSIEAISAPPENCATQRKSVRPCIIHRRVIIHRHVQIEFNYELKIHGWIYSNLWHNKTPLKRPTLGACDCVDVVIIYLKNHTH